jgi:hypothetical protein
MAKLQIAHISFAINKDELVNITETKTCGRQGLGLLKPSNMSALFLLLYFFSICIFYKFLFLKLGIYDLTIQNKECAPLEVIKHFLIFTAFEPKVYFHDTIAICITKGSTFNLLPQSQVRSIYSVSRMLHHMNQFQTLILVNSWVARLMCLPITFPINLAKGVKGEPLRLRY